MTPVKSAELSVRGDFQPIELRRWRNNVGITTAGDTGNGRFNVWRNSLPAGQLPSGRRIEVDGVPFDLPPVAAGAPDNVRCEGQHVDVPTGRYEWIYLLAGGERRVEDEIALHFADGSVDFEALRVSDFWVARAAFGETAALTTTVMHYPHHVQRDVPATVWCQRVPVTRRTPLRALRLPDNVAVHIFAMTLCRAERANVPVSHVRADH